VDVEVVVTLRGTVTGRAPLDGTGTVSPLGHVVSAGTLSSHGAGPVVYAGTVTLTGAPRATSHVAGPRRRRFCTGFACFGPTTPTHSPGCFWSDVG
jgi:hypothetical protein